MTVDAARAALESHPAFEPADDDVAVATTPFDATVGVDSADGRVRYVVSVEVPDIDAAVAGDVVGATVREGWLDTFGRRITALGDVTSVDPETPTVERVDAGTVRVEITFTADDPDRAAEDAKALVDYVEGTYVQGVIPGYSYREPVDGLLQRAGDRSDGQGRPKL